MALYESVDHPFSIQFPDYLSSVPLSEEDKDFFAAQYLSASGEEFLALVEEDLVENGVQDVTLSEYTNLVISALEGELNFVLRRQVTTPKGHQAEILEFEADGGSFKGIRSIYLHENRVGFSATFIGPRQIFEENRSIYQSAFSSFQVTD